MTIRLAARRSLGGDEAIGPGPHLHHRPRPKAGAIASATSRLTVSLVPPAAKPPRMRTGRSGKASAGWLAAISRRAAAMAGSFMVLFPPMVMSLGAAVCRRERLRLGGGSASSTKSQRMRRVARVDDLLDQNVSAVRNGERSGSAAPRSRAQLRRGRAPRPARRGRPPRSRPRPAASPSRPMARHSG